MLEQFQQAFADLIASPEFVSQVRDSPDVLRDRYALSDREWRRLVAVANQPGMECNCMLYRANRLTPIIVNLPGLCEALADELRPLVSEYWANNAHTNANFLVESYRFCEFVEDKIRRGVLPGNALLSVLLHEKTAVKTRLDAIYSEDVVPVGTPIVASGTTRSR